MNRFAAGDVYDGKGQLRFKSLYKYNASGQISEETQLNTDGKTRSRIVYSYNQAGKQTGYEFYDGAGNLLGRTSSPGGSTIPTNPKSR
jgi:YD repeat-containing protein